MQHNKEILTICKNITDLDLKHKIIFNVLEQRWNQARLLSEGLLENYPENSSFARLDDLITDSHMLSIH